MYFDNLLGDENEEEVVYLNLRQKLTKRIIKKAPNNAIKPKIGSLVTINLVGIVEPNIKVEDLRSFQCHLGDYEVVDGLERILPSMKVGEIASVSMDSDFAYGIYGLQDSAYFTNDFLVPPYSPISYGIELVAIKTEESKDLEDDELLCTYVARKKARCDFWLIRLEFKKAIHLFKRARTYLLKIKDEGKAKALMQRLALNCDLGSYMKCRVVRVFNAALIEVESVLSLEPDNTDALFRKAKILKCVGNTTCALDIMIRVTELDPEHQDAAAEVSELKYTEAFENYRGSHQNVSGFNIRRPIIWFMVTNVILWIYFITNKVLNIFTKTR
ncbi:peptidyl-prolyl cis-trans isomerase FKBP8-like [Drosophila serrata]|uniref:peptidyl-prolyl cis-trans isomerase FKBP8-like n=1 Tax=Drosophila serrata TaxID=7274 RepID=UPI000A1CFA6F|nr:peptidyl-prolyl cis-trans isomerase FKBP8-like [Drosophila serrata]